MAAGRKEEKEELGAPFYLRLTGLLLGVGILVLSRHHLLARALRREASWRVPGPRSDSAHDQPGLRPPESAPKLVAPSSQRRRRSELDDPERAEGEQPRLGRISSHGRRRGTDLFHKRTDNQYSSILGDTMKPTRTSRRPSCARSRRRWASTTCGRSSASPRNPPHLEVRRRRGAPTVLRLLLCRPPQALVHDDGYCLETPGGGCRMMWADRAVAAARPRHRRAVTGRSCRIATRWTRSCSCSGRGCSRTR